MTASVVDGFAGRHVCIFERSPVQTFHIWFEVFDLLDAPAMENKKFGCQ